MARVQRIKSRPTAIMKKVIYMFRCQVEIIMCTAFRWGEKKNRSPLDSEEKPFCIYNTTKVSNGGDVSHWYSAQFFHWNFIVSSIMAFSISYWMPRLCVCLCSYSRNRLCFFSCTVIRWSCHIYQFHLSIISDFYNIARSIIIWTIHISNACVYTQTSGWQPTFRTFLPFSDCV